MARGRTLGICAILLSVGVSNSAVAQDAVETAQILSGTGQMQGGGRSLGSAISRSLNGAGDVIAGSTSAPRTANAGANPAIHRTDPVPANVDPLARSDAPTYRLGNGASIRVSGGFQSDPVTSCVKNCPAARVP